jgi:transposase
VAVSEETEETGPFAERVAALDIGKASLVACLRVPSGTRPGRRRQEVSEWSTMTDDLLALADRLVAEGVELVVMEATGDYWRSPFYVLEAAGLRCWLVNARHVKNLPGRPKTDKADAVWLCKVAERGMCSPSYVPDEPIRRLRNLTRYRCALVHERTREMQRVEKLLEDTQIKISVVASDIFGVSGRAMLEALIAGERDPVRLADLARGRMRPKKAELERALRGDFRAHHATLLRMMLGRVDRLTADVDALTGQVTAALAEIEGAAQVHPDTGEIVAPGTGGPPAVGAAPTGEACAEAGEARQLTLAERLAEIPGIGPVAAQAIIAEVGTDVSRFPTPGHLASWAGLAPKDRESAGRAKPARTAKGNRYLGGILGQAAMSVAKTQTFYGVRYRRVRAARGPQKAIVAVARSMTGAIWHLIKDPDARYRDLGPDYYDRRKDPAKQAAVYRRGLERLGFKVALTPLEPAEAAA